MDLKTYAGIILIFAAGLEAEALDFDQRFNLEPAVYYREIHQKGLSDIDQSLDLFMQAAADFHVARSGFNLDFKPEIRGLNGRGSGAKYPDPSAISTRSPDRLMNLRQKLDWKDEWYLEMEKLNLSYAQSDLEISIGRKPLSLGVLKIFSVWNKFSRPLPVSSGPSPVFSSDSAHARYQSGNWSFLGGAVFGRENADQINFIESTHFGEVLELHLLAAKWWERNTAGFALAKDLWGATVRWENLWIANGGAGERHELQSGLGVEYALNAKWTLLSEELMQSDGDHYTSEYLKPKKSRFQSLRAYLYNYTQLQYKLTSLWTLQGAALTNMADWSVYAIGKVNYSFSESTELYGEVDLPTGRTSSEFSRQTVTFVNGYYVGAPTQFVAGAKVYF